jgi:hypothetical protein
MAALADARKAKAGEKDPLANQLAVIAGGAASAYSAAAQDFGFRKPGSDLLWSPKGLDGYVSYPLALPSTGRPDMVYVLNSAINSPGFENRAGALGDHFRAMDDDDVANLASRMTAAQVEGEMSRIRTLPGGELEGLLNQMNEGDGEKTKKALEALKDIGGDDVGKTGPGQKGELGQINVMVMDPDHPEKGYAGGVVLFRVRGDDGQIRFVDAEGGTYDSLKDYQENNGFAEDHQLLLPADLAADIDTAGTLRQAQGHDEPGWKQGLKYTGYGLLLVGSGVLIATGLGAPAGLAIGGTTLGAIGATAMIGSGVAFGTTSAASTTRASRSATPPPARSGSPPADRC